MYVQNDGIPEKSSHLSLNQIKEKKNKKKVAGLNMTLLERLLTDTHPTKQNTIFNTLNANTPITFLQYVSQKKHRSLFTVSPTWELQR